MGRRKAEISTEVETDELELLSQLDTVSAEPPSMTDHGWSDYVKTFFEPDELDPEGHPTTDGLRRVAEKLLGPIVACDVRVVQFPDVANGYRCTCECEVSFAWEGNFDDIRHFRDAADTYPGNCDPQFSRFAVATTATRAKSRALRDALKLRKVVSAEEITTLAVSESGLTNFITPSQIKCIEKTCRDLNISVLGFINSGSLQYKHISHIRYDKALEMLEFLNGYLQEPQKVPASLIGFEKNWKKVEV